MERVDDFESFSPAEAPSSPVPERKLKRLKKSKMVQDNSPKLETLDFGESNSQDSEESKLETLDLEKWNNQDLEEPNSGFRSRSKRFEDENGLGSDVGGLGNEEDAFGAKRTLDFDSVAEDRRSDVEMEKENGELRVEEPEKKRRTFDGFENNKAKKRVKSVSDDDNAKSTVVTKRKTEKERRENLKQLRAESQRLLRETRDAVFKSAPLIQKPISSVLEKIRQRKLEVSKKSVTADKPSFMDDNDVDCDSDDFSHGFMVNIDSKNVPAKDRGDGKVTKVPREDSISCPPNVENGLSDLFVDASNNTLNPSGHESIPSLMAEDEQPKEAFRAPIDDTQDLFFGSQTSASQDEFPEDSPESPIEEVLAPSVLAMNLKLGSVPPDDVSSDEDNDKESIDPGLQQSVDLSSPPNGDPVKAFVDDEAEEEDDGDNDILRFQDNEEDEDIEDVEELKDMIATEYEEKPMDTERRNEFHQKWLEQQDAAGTEKLLQRFKCGSKQMDMTLPEEEDVESDEDSEDCDDEDTEDLAPVNDVRMNLRRIKEMIPHMFTDKQDAYISSDDEETEKSIVKQCLFEKSEEQATFLSPAQDKDSKEVFGLIKKLNVVPDFRKKPKTSALSDMRLIGGNRAVSSKSTFLSRGSNQSLPSYQKHGSSMARSFVFERSDNYNRSATSVSEDSSDMIQRENRHTKPASARLYNSQIRPSTRNTKAAAETNSGTALIEIFRRSSLHSSHCIQDSVVSHTESILATFKLEKPMKKASNVSIRTL